MAAVAASPSAARRRILVVGGGVAGAETALTLALGLPEDEIVLVSRWPAVRVLPELVYVPFGVNPRRIDLPLDALATCGVRVVVAEVTSIDAEHRTVTTTKGVFEADVLIAAPGAQAIDGGHRSLRTLDDALRIRAELADTCARAAAGERRSIVIRSAAEHAWTAPACELAMLIGAWIRAQRLDALVETTIVTSDTDPFEWFGPVGEATVESALRRARVRVSSSVPIGRFDDVEGDLTIDFGTLQAREVTGLPGRAPDGWYATDASFQVAPSVFVVGDALSLPYRAGFASAWQARRVLSELGGDLNLLGREVDGVPIGSVEYQMDLADGVLRARIANADSLGQPFLGHDADVDVVSGARPEKLAGLLVHERILGHGHDLVDPPLAFRDLLLRQSRSAA